MPQRGLIEIINYQLQPLHLEHRYWLQVQSKQIKETSQIRFKCFTVVHLFFLAIVKKCKFVACEVVEMYTSAAEYHDVSYSYDE